MSTLYIEYSKIYSIYWQFQDKLKTLIDKVDEFKEYLSQTMNNSFFAGKSSEALKEYFNEVHIPFVEAAKATAQTMIDLISLYKAGYYEIDQGTNFVLDEQEISATISKLADCYSEANDLKLRIRNALMDIADIKCVDAPSFSDIETQHFETATTLSTLLNNMSTHESEHSSSIDSNCEVLVGALASSLQIILSMAGFDKNTYLPNNVTGENLFLELQQMTALQNEVHAELKENIDAIEDFENELKTAAEDQMNSAFWSIAGDILVIAVDVGVIIGSGILEVGSFGSLTPVMVGTCASAGTSITFKISDIHENCQAIKYGSVGDIDTETYNFIRDSKLINGNETVYNVLDFGASVATGGFNSLSEAGTLNAATVARAFGESAVSEVAGNFAGDVTGAVVGKYTNNQTLINASSFLAGTAAGYGVSKHFESQSIKRAEAGRVTTNSSPSYTPGSEGVASSYQFDINSISGSSTIPAGSFADNASVGSYQFSTGASAASSAAPSAPAASSTSGTHTSTPSTANVSSNAPQFSWAPGKDNVASFALGGGEAASSVFIGPRKFSSDEKDVPDLDIGTINIPAANN